MRDTHTHKATTAPFPTYCFYVGTLHNCTPLQGQSPEGGREGYPVENVIMYMYLLLTSVGKYHRVEYST